MAAGQLPGDEGQQAVPTTFIVDTTIMYWKTSRSMREAVTPFRIQSLRRFSTSGHSK